MSYSASLSMQNVSSEFSTSWCTESVQLYGSTTVSDTCKVVLSEMNGKTGNHRGSSSGSDTRYS
jgi:hypothetical protein